MKKYELLMILEQSISSEALENFTDDLANIITLNKGEIIKSDSLGVKELATPIKKQSKGHYFLIHFQGNNEVLKELNQKFKIFERLLRHIIVEYDSVYTKSA